MKVTISIDFSNYSEAVDALARLDAADRPNVDQLPLFEVLTPTLPAHEALDARAVFGGAAPLVPSVPAPPAVTPPAVVSPPTAAIAPTGAPALTLDAEGIPWDSRIHGETRTTNKDGTWRAKRGLNDGALVARIKAELLQAVAGAVVPVPVAVVPVPVAVVPVPVAVPPPPSAPTFVSLMMLVNSSLANGKLNEATLAGVMSPYGLQNIPQVAARPDLVGPVFDMVTALVSVA